MTFRDNPRLGSVGNTSTDHMTITPIGQPVKRPRGRPRKRPRVETQTHDTSGCDGQPMDDTNDGQLIDTKDHLTADATGDHTKTSSARKPEFWFKCLAEDCDYEFIAKISLIEHMKNSHRIQDTYECDDCDDMFLTTDALNQHKHQTHSLKPFVCTHESCGMCFIKESTLKQHILAIHTSSGEQSLEGNDNREDLSGSDVVIDDTDDSDSDYVAPVGRPGSEFKCDYVGCDRVLSSSQAFRRHQLTHSVDKPFKCPVTGCHFQTIRRYKLRNHLDKHSVGDQPYLCAVEGCGESCFSAEDLSRHHRLRHKWLKNPIHRPVMRKKEKKFKCSHVGCDAVMTHRDLKRHQWTHTADRPFKCHAIGCEFKCIRRGQMEGHVMTKHTADEFTDNSYYRYNSLEDTSGDDLDVSVGANDSMDNSLIGGAFQCDYEDCRKVCSEWSTLKRHKLTHSAERPHKCPAIDCQFQTIRPYQLRNHMKRKHEGVAYYWCPRYSCGKLFLTDEELAEHTVDNHSQSPVPVSGQSSAKVFSCGFIGCNKKFAKKCDLIGHRFTHTGDKEFQCTAEGCAERFARRAYLND
ncbi:unnamed protein product, partial [Medioppia subpectinata]